jgi:hypothetical protein
MLEQAVPPRGMADEYWGFYLTQGFNLPARCRHSVSTPISCFPSVFLLSLKGPVSLGFSSLTFERLGDGQEVELAAAINCVHDIEDSCHLTSKW